MNNRYASLTIRKGQFLVDMSMKDQKKMILLRPGTSPGSFEPIAEIPWMSRPNVIKALYKIVALLEATADIKEVKGLHLLVDPNAEQAREKTKVAPTPAKKPRTPPTAVKTRTRTSIW